MAEIWTVINLEIDGKPMGTVRVPFSADEVETIREVREVRERWYDERLRGSGWHRELYTWIIIPWGTAMVNREKAEEKARASIQKINGLLSRPDKHPELESMEDDLVLIANGLLRVFPDAAQSDDPSLGASK